MSFIVQIKNKMKFYSHAGEFYIVPNVIQVGIIVVEFFLKKDI